MQTSKQTPLIASRCLRRRPWAVFLNKWDSAFSFSRASFEVTAGLAGHIEVPLMVCGKQVAQRAAGPSVAGRRDEADELGKLAGADACRERRHRTARRRVGGHGGGG